MRRRTFLAGLVPAAIAWADARELACDVAVIGGGVGGFAAALAALRAGMRVVLTEETSWIGGQLTAQAVPPDEHPWIEQFGCTRGYRAYRNGVREYYRRNYPLTEQARARADLNPGNAWVSGLSHEFRVSLAVLEAMLAPYASSGRLTLLTEHAPVGATADRDRVTSVQVRDANSGRVRTIVAKYFIDATELGELLPMTGTEFVTGAESRRETGELHAAPEAQPANSQSFTFCFAMDHLEGEDHTIEKPREYEEWKSYVPALVPEWSGRLLSWTMSDAETHRSKPTPFTPNPGPGDDELNFWTYRRIADRGNFTEGTYRSDITLVNWPQNDFLRGDLLTASASRQRELLASAKQLSLSLLYWMQTEAPRPKGGYGWKGLRLRPDIVGTADGLAKAPYIRESRRIRAEFTVLEEHVGTQMRAKPTAAPFRDTVGIGGYRLDLHPSSGGNNGVYIGALPFQIPLGALIPRRMENLLAASKNIGTTHVTNGCYREHPTEWNIGEAAGAVAARATATGEAPRAMRNKAALLAAFQESLAAQGFELQWPAVHPL